MKTKSRFEIAKGIYKFDTGPFNWYLLEENGCLTLVDAGFPGHYAALKKGLVDIGFSLKDIVAIVLTHAHADHIGFAEKVRSELKVPVFIHKEDAAMAQKALQLPWFGLLSNAWRTYTATMLGVAIVNGVFTFPHLRKVLKVSDNESLDVPGKPRIIHTPGHTDGEVVLYLENRGVLISGDTLVTRNLLTGESGMPQLTNPILNNNYTQAQRSLGLIQELGELTLLPGHGAPWTGDMKEAVYLAERDYKN